MLSRCVDTRHTLLSFPVSVSGVRHILSWHFCKVLIKEIMALDCTTETPDKHVWQAWRFLVSSSSCKRLQTVFCRLADFEDFFCRVQVQYTTVYSSSPWVHFTQVVLEYTLRVTMLNFLQTLSVLKYTSEKYDVLVFETQTVQLHYITSVWNIPKRHYSSMDSSKEVYFNTLLSNFYHISNEIQCAVMLINMY